jgi:hypothetical protein
MLDYVVGKDFLELIIRKWPGEIIDVMNDIGVYGGDAI